MDANETPQQLTALWAPWRVEYFEHKPVDPEFLSAAANATDDAAHLVLRRGKSGFLMMNRYPYAVGHLMAVPYRRVGELQDLTDAEKLELWKLAEMAQAAMRKVMNAQGFNIGLNLGTCAGAGAADHLHLHIVPRWTGDQNFMPILGQTRVIPEGLMPLYEKLRAELGQ